MVNAQMITRASGRPVLFDARIRTAVFLGICAVSFGCDKASLLGPIGSSISLTAASQVVPPGGSTQLTAILLENSGQPVPNGTTVRFTTSLGRIEPVEAQTRNGVATAMFVAGSDSGTAEIRAISGLASAPGSNTSTTPTPTTPAAPAAPGATPAAPTPTTPTSATSAGNVVRILVGAAGAQALTLSATPSTVSPAGSSVEVSAFVTDTNGNRLPGVPVTFSTTRGTLNPGVANTDGDGIAKTTLTASEAATISARVGSQTATLEVRQSTVASFALAIAPTNPSAGQPVSLTITPAANTAARVAVNWGDGSNAQDIGVVAAARSVTHTYGAPGFYTIEASGTSADGEVFSNTIPVTVASQPPVQVTANPTIGPVGSAFTFTITPTTGALIKEIKINYGDGTEDNLGAISTQTTRQKTYGGLARSVTVTVTQTETNGRVTIATVTITLT
jgi:hypothetical protein